MSKTYLITLTPTGKFFFGGDMTFTVNGEESEFTSYIIRSNKFPQQTSLLGMLRFLILRNNSEIFDAVAQTIKNDKRSNASNLIGPRSFEKTGKEGNFGKIKRLYPCFLQKDGQDVTSLPKDEKHEVTFGETIGCLNGKKVSVPKEIKDFDPKDGIDTLYRIGEKDFGEKDVFEEDVCNGINRDIKTGKTEDDALFKQVSYRLKDGFRFAFYAEVDLDDLSNYSGQLVSVGGDNSQRVPTVATSTIKAVLLALVIATMPNISVASDKNFAEPNVIVAESVDDNEFMPDTFVFDDFVWPELVSAGNSESGKDKSMKIPVPKKYQYNANDMYQFPFNQAFKVVGKAEFKENGVELYYLSCDNNDNDAEHLALLIPSEEFGEPKGSYYIIDLVKITGDWAYDKLNLLGDWIKVEISENGNTSILEYGEDGFRMNKYFALSVLNATCQDRSNCLPFFIYGLGDRLNPSGD